MNAFVAPEDQNLSKELSDAKRLLLEPRLRGRIPKPRGDHLILPRPSGSVVPISAEQHRLWLHAQTNPDVPIYNEALTIHRHGPFNLAILEAAFNEFLRRHEAWRTCFSFVEGGPVQIVHPDLRIKFPFVDLCSLSEESRGAEALRLATHDAKTPIPLESVPLFRGIVVRMSSEEYRVYLTLHHIIFDGVSIYQIVVPELAALYEAFSSATPNPLPEPCLQYGDYSVWRRNCLHSPEVASQLEYWKRELAGDLLVLRLPADRNRPPRVTNRGAMECFSFSKELVRSLHALSQAKGVTLFMTLLAAYKTLLFRYSGQRDLIVGTVADARRRPELQGVVGYFLDTLPIRTHPTPAMRFVDFMVEARDKLIGALGAADAPFDRIVQAVQPQRSTQFHPIFQAFFALEPPGTTFPPGWDLTQMDVDPGAAKFDLYLELEERANGMAGRFLYSTDLFDTTTIKRMVGHLTTTLEAVCANPECTIAALPILTPSEVAQLRGPDGWNNTARSYPKLPLHQLIEAQADRTPDAIAVEFGEAKWTFRQLIARANTISSHLRQTGVERGSVVAVVLHRSLDMLAGLLAILKAGAAYLPLDPEVPRARRDLCLYDAKPAAILAQRAVQDLPTDVAPILTIEELRRTNLSDLRPTSSVESDDLAYVIYTSGTTGNPKGVEIPHSSIVNLLASMQREPGFMSSDRLLAVTTVCFDIAALELFLPLISGGCVTIASFDVARDPCLLASAIEASKCTVMQATPATWLALLSAGWNGPQSPREFKVLCGGEPLSRELAERLLATGAEVWNMYGPTETTVWSTIHRVHHGNGPVSIGKPIANTTAYILDEQQQLVPVGVPGKLYLGGSGLARGYRNRQELTAERFTVVEAAGIARLYDTGDLAARHTDGTIECLGRIDNQVKIRGFRVELEAVEAAVRRHPHVSAAAARVWPDAAGSTRLSVYVVGNGTSPPNTAALRQFLRVDYPDFMIPSDVIEVDALPLSVNGKIDRTKLPPPRSGSKCPVQTGSATAVEDQLAEIWKSLLGLDAVNSQDSFFDLGGQSLMVAALQQRIGQVFGRRPSMAMLFQAQTLERQAALLEASQGRSSSGIQPLQPKGARPAIYWLHPSPLISNLTTALGTDQPTIGVGLTEDDLALLSSEPTLENIAACHVKRILNFKSRGPYYLGGLCVGGILAFEAASQLRRAGHEVPLVTLLDAQNPVFFRPVGTIPNELSKAYFYLRQALVTAHPQDRATLRQRLQRFFARVHQASLQPGFQPEYVTGDSIVIAAAYCYKPTTYPGNVLLLQPSHRPRGVDHGPGWKTVVTGSLIQRDIAAHHDDLLNRDVARNVAAAIFAVLMGNDLQTPMPVSPESDVAVLTC
jgi:amino acid adenylation domain-containing protein